MADVVPFMEEIGHRASPPITTPSEDRYVIDCPFPARFDEDKRWLLDEGPISWDEVLVRWQARGPMNRDYVTRLQRGYRERLATG